MKLKVKLINPNCKLEILNKGEWIDLKSSKNMKLYAPFDYLTKTTAFISGVIPLGVAIQLPKYFEANIVPRSSTYKNYAIIQTNSFGVIDSSYCGDDDEWMMPVLSFGDKFIREGDRIAQFRIKPSQFAPWWVKLKWLFTSKIEIKYVDSLNNKNRGGFGSTGR